MIEKGYFQSGSNRLFYVLSKPEQQTGKAGIIFVHAANGNRLGPHRMYVELAEKFDSYGICTFRFDLTGCGDSTGSAPQDRITVEDSDVVSGINFFRKKANLESVLLFGISKGARICYAVMSNYLLPLRGVILLSASVITNSTAIKFSANRLREYIHALKNPANIRRLFTGKIDYKGIWKTLTYAIDITQKQKTTDKKQFRTKCPILFIYGSRDTVAEESIQYYMERCRENCSSSQFHIIQGANHSFFHYKWKEEIFDITIQWLSKIGNKERLKNE